MSDRFPIGPVVTQSTVPIRFAIASPLPQSSWEDQFDRSGEGGIRTRGEIAPTRHFQCRTFGRSVTSPKSQVVCFQVLINRILSHLSGRLLAQSSFCCKVGFNIPRQPIPEKALRQRTRPAEGGMRTGEGGWSETSAKSWHPARVFPPRTLLSDHSAPVSASETATASQNLRGGT